MKKNVFALAMAVLSGIIIGLSSCNKDELDEKERLTLLDSLNNITIVQYSVNVISAANTGILKSGNEIKGLAGAIVTLNRAGTLVSVTTNDQGMAVFNNLRGGNVSVSIAIDGYSDVTFIANLTPEENLNQNTTNASTMIPLFPLSGDWLTEIKGVITFQSDLTNKTPEMAVGVKVSAVVDINEDFMNTFFPNNTGQGSVVQISYSDVLMTATTNENGEYSLSVPSAAQGLDVIIDVAEVATDQKIVLNTLYGENVTGVQTVRTVFGNSGIIPTSIPDITGAFVTIGAPTGAVGVYTQQASLANPVVLNGSVTSISINNPGSGYTAAPNVIISGDGVGAQATAIIGAGGIISAINVTNGGSNYTYATASLYIASYRENAKAVPVITSGGAISSITITNTGEGYVTPPVVTINSHTDIGAGATCVVYQSQISGGSINSITVTNGGSNYEQYANYPVSAENSNIPSTGLYAKAYSGKPMIRDLYLGTGKRSITN